MNNTKRKGRPVMSRYVPDNRQQRSSRLGPGQGVYNNSHFMHAATSFVGNLVQIQTQSGSIFEGVFKTFSPSFDVALELAHCTKNNQNINLVDDTKNLPNFMIFKPSHIVSITSKDIDVDYATGGTFQTDSAISAKCNGSRVELKPLEPWEPSGGGCFNGDFELELDGNANGWDANEMFNKNAEMFNVQTTFDDSLSDYTVPLEIKETEEFKEAEAKAEKLAQEIENNPICKERLDLENGDEESLFAAVERPVEKIPDKNSSSSLTSNSSTLSTTPPASAIVVVPSQQQQQQQQQQQNINSHQQNQNISSQKGSSAIMEKYVVPPKRKNIPNATKITRSGGPISNNNNSIPQQITHNNSKNNNYQPIQNAPTYVLNPTYTHINTGSTQYSRHSNLSQSKVNGDGNTNNNNNNNNNTKSLPQRNIRQYSQTQQNVSNYVDQNNQTSINKISHGHNHLNQQVAGGDMHVSHVAHHIGTNQMQSQPPRQTRVREDQIQDLRKFQQDFQLAPSSQQLPPQGHAQINQQSHEAKTPSVSPHQSQQQQQQPSVSPPHQQQMPPPLQQSQTSHPHGNIHIHNQPPPPVVIQQQLQSQHQQQQNDNMSSNIQQQKVTQIHNVSQQTQQDNAQNYTTMNQASQHQKQSNNSNLNSVTQVGPNQQTGSHINTVNEAPQSNTNPDKNQPPTGVVKKHVLNPAAKPFTPRSPSTSNPSRPHTPQTPGQPLTANVFNNAGPHVNPGPQHLYIMSQQYQTPQHQHHQQNRMRRTPITTAQIQVSAAAATGQPLLTAGPIPSFIYSQSPHGPPFQSQPFQQMVRMYHEPPPQPLQFLTQTPPSTTPSPGQPQHFHSAPQPSPAGQGPTAFAPTQPGGPFSMMCIAQHPSQLVPNYYQSVQGQNSHQQIQVLMPPQHGPQ